MKGSQGWRYRFPHRLSRAERKVRKTATLATIPRDMATPMLNTPWWWATIRGPKLNRVGLLGHVLKT
jgi:hypothetical protein